MVIRQPYICGGPGASVQALGPLAENHLVTTPAGRDRRHVDPLVDRALSRPVVLRRPRHEERAGGRADAER